MKDTAWGLAVADQENARAGCIGHIAPRLTVRNVRRTLEELDVPLTIPDKPAVIRTREEDK